MKFISVQFVNLQTARLNTQFRLKRFFQFNQRKTLVESFLYTIKSHLKKASQKVWQKLLQRVGNTLQFLQNEDESSFHDLLEKWNIYIDNSKTENILSRNITLNDVINEYMSQEINSSLEGFSLNAFMLMINS